MDTLTMFGYRTTKSFLCNETNQKIDFDLGSFVTRTKVSAPFFSNLTPVFPDGRLSGVKGALRRISSSSSFSLSLPPLLLSQTPPPQSVTSSPRKLMPKIGPGWSLRFFFRNLT